MQEEEGETLAPLLEMPALSIFQSEMTVAFSILCRSRPQSVGSSLCPIPVSEIAAFYAFAGTGAIIGAVDFLRLISEVDDFFIALRAPKG